MLIAGGGPAGAATAYRLARLGYAVAIVTAPSPQGADRIEVLAPSVAPLADALPLELLSHPATPVSGTHLIWSGEAEYVPAMRGTALIRRAGFDQALRAAAGVPILGVLRARKPRRVAGLWHVPVTTHGGAYTLTAKFLIDAGGRGGALLGRRVPAGPATCAVTAVWRDARLPVGAMLVEAVPEGWCWGASTADGELHSAVFLDATDAGGAAALRARAARILCATTLFAPALRTATALRAGLTDATPRHAPDIAGADWLRVGDAAFAPDPLSSQGLAMALRAGLHAAAAVHTILSCRDTEAALAFFRARVADTMATHSATIGRLYADCPRDTAFWRARRHPHAAAPRSLSLLSDAAIALAPNATIGPMPALVGDHIEPIQAVHVSAAGRPIAWIGGVPAASLLSGLREPKTTSEVLTAWSHIFPDGRAADVLLGLLNNGVLHYK